MTVWSNSLTTDKNEENKGEPEETFHKRFVYETAWKSKSCIKHKTFFIHYQMNSNDLVRQRWEQTAQKGHPDT